jgi:endonuclease/exonuclease/phosphatase family metal-dependent hydrolase
MRCMTYNIRLGIQAGLDAIAAEICQEGADLVALQEVGNGWSMGPSGDTAKTLSALTGLPFYEHVPAICEAPGVAYGHALLSRWPISLARIEMLPQRDDEPRAVLTSSIAIPLSPRPVTFVSTHLSYKDDRDLQTEILIQTFEDLIANSDNGLIILAGDLNEADDVPWIRDLAQRYCDADGALRRKTYPSEDATVRIDYLIASDGNWHDTHVGSSHEASDHHWVSSTWSP